MGTARRGVPLPRPRRCRARQPVTDVRVEALAPCNFNLSSQMCNLLSSTVLRSRRMSLATTRCGCRRRRRYALLAVHDHQPPACRSASDARARAPRRPGAGRDRAVQLLAESSDRPTLCGGRHGGATITIACDGWTPLDEVAIHLIGKRRRSSTLCGRRRASGRRCARSPPPCSSRTSPLARTSTAAAAARSRSTRRRAYHVVLFDGRGRSRCARTCGVDEAAVAVNAGTFSSGGWRRLICRSLSSAR